MARAPVGVRALKDTTIDAIITDLRLPGVCGMDLIERARELAPDAAIANAAAIRKLLSVIHSPYWPSRPSQAYSPPNG